MLNETFSVIFKHRAPYYPFFKKQDNALKRLLLVETKKSFTSKVIFCQWKLLDDDWQVSLDLLLITSVRIYFQEARIIVGSKNAFPHIDNLVTCEIVTFQAIQEALKIQLDSKIKVYWHSIKIGGLENIFVFQVVTQLWGLMQLSDQPPPGAPVKRSPATIF